jgi:hypothetical protein
VTRRFYSKAELEALLPGLQDAGCPVTVKEQQTISGLIQVEQDEGPSLIGVNYDRLTYCMIWASISVKCTQIAVRGYQIMLPWEDPNFYLLEDPWETHASAKTYRFPCEGIEYPRDQVLNHRTGMLRRGQCIDGVLMGVGMKPIPSEYTHRSTAELYLSVVTALGECMTPIIIEIDRSAEFTSKFKPSPVRRRVSLFDKPDAPRAVPSIQSRLGSPSEQLTSASSVPGDFLNSNVRGLGGD